MDAFKVVRDFEAALCHYTGAPYCVTTTSCTTAIMLAMAYHLDYKGGAVGEILQGKLPKVSMPRYTYVGVPYAVKEAGGWPTFRTEDDWKGAYRLDPFPVYDSARRFRKGMYNWSTAWSDRNENSPALKDEMVCLSFHWSKILGLGQGGAILHSDPEADDWLRRARFDGRTEGVPPAEDTFINRRAWHAYMKPETAAEGLVRLGLVDPKAPDLPWSGYADCSKIAAFQ